MSNKKILICDDDEGIIDLLEVMLDDSPFEVITELNSLNMQQLIKKEKPNLIILDLWMPVISGDQILGMIRSNPETENLPVIAISASRDGEQIAMAAGATAYLAKPFDINVLTNLINLYLEAKNQEQLSA
ncbi:response regulator [Pedobacter aquatilis]|uniref:response regulator n=1 Tax=Pedobacter aquatilis TaxID=351343 RepID=UPI0025B43C32|nr:response regulator [Pedobacter aquatilis]MDN3588802.1 response regulator [Pedobacter aquatilis]